MHENPGRKDLLDEAELLDPPGGATLRLRFSGQFEGQPVTWLATLRALANPEPEQKQEQGETPAAPPGSYIDIGADQVDGIPITVGLPVAAIDEPTIRKAIIMIRRYRRLRRGRHDYGPPEQGAPRTRP